MAHPRKFLFEQSFDHLAGRGAKARQAEEKFSRVELDAAREAARAEARDAALSEAAAAAEAKAAAAVAALARDLAALLGAVDARAAETQRLAVAALRAIVAKTLPAFAAKAPLAEVEAFAAKYFREAIDEPRIVLRVADEVYEPLQARLDGIAATAGYAGRVVLLADTALAAGDARVEWADGGVERSLAEALSDFDAAMARLADPAATPNPVPP